MDYKVIGAVLIITACGGCGFITAGYHITNIRLMQNLVDILDYMVCELRYRATPLPQLCRQAGESVNGKVSKVFIVLSDELQRQVSPNIETCMTSALCEFNDASGMITEMLMEVSGHLGVFDLPGQIAGIEKCRDRCCGNLEKLKQNKEIRLRSYRTLGLCAGAAIAILFV